MGHREFKGENYRIFNESKFLVPLLGIIIGSFFYQAILFNVLCRPKNQRPGTRALTSYQSLVRKLQATLLIRLLLAASILSAVYRVLRNSLRSNMLALFPAYGRDLRSLAYGAGCFFKNYHLQTLLQK